MAYYGVIPLIYHIFFIDIMNRRCLIYGMGRKEWHRILEGLDEEGDNALAQVFHFVATDADYVSAIKHLYENNLTPMHFHGDNEDIVREMTKQALIQSPHEPSVVYFQAILDYMDKKYNDALDRLRYIQSKYPAFQDTLELTPEILFYGEQYWASIEPLEQSLEKTPNDSLIRSRLAFSYLKTGQIDKMKEEKQRAIEGGGLDEDASRAILVKCVPPQEGRKHKPD